MLLQMPSATRSREGVTVCSRLCLAIASEFEMQKTRVEQ
jgi:hypothetical protein